MTKIYTENDLLLYVYQELPASEVVQLEQELKQQPDLANKLAEIRAAVSLIDKIEQEPSATSIAMILEYASELEKADQHVS